MHCKRKKKEETLWTIPNFLQNKLLVKQQQQKPMWETEVSSDLFILKISEDNNLFLYLLLQNLTL